MLYLRIDNCILTSRIFHIEYSIPLSANVKSAVANVFSNYATFLAFNNYIPKFWEIRIGDRKEDHFNLSNVFVSNLEMQNFHHEEWFKEAAIIKENGKKDFVGTCFYMINSLQEYGENERDFLGRFDYESSYQIKFSCVHDNLVLDYFQEISVLLFSEKIPLENSKYFLSHDIDHLSGGWRSEAKRHIYNLNFIKALQSLYKKFKGLDSWRNIKEIVELEKERKVHSTFFWLGKKGSTNFKNVQNADYHLSDSYVEESIKHIEKSQFHRNGLHKSISDTSLDEEVHLLKGVDINRYHYLKFHPKEDYLLLEKSKIQSDCSLGFSNQIGFRNNYGLPFYPYDPINQQQYTFLEYPLHIMDSSLFFYLDCKNDEKMFNAVNAFLRRHNKSCVIGILWHNNFVHQETYGQFLDILNLHIKKSVWE